METSQKVISRSIKENSEFFSIAHALGMEFPALQNNVGYELFIKVDDALSYTSLGFYPREDDAYTALRNWVVEALLEGSGFWDPLFEDEAKLNEYICNSSTQKIVSEYFANWEEDSFEIKKIVIEDNPTMLFLGYEIVDESFLADLFSQHYSSLSSEIFQKYASLASSIRPEHEVPISPGTAIYVTNVVLDQKYSFTLGYSAFEESGRRLLRNWVVRELSNLAADMGEENLSPDNEILKDLEDEGIVQYYFDENKHDSFSIKKFVVESAPTLVYP